MSEQTNDQISQRFGKIKRAANQHTKPTLCSTFAFAPTAPTLCKKYDYGKTVRSIKKMKATCETVKLIDEINTK